MLAAAAVLAPTAHADEFVVRLGGQFETEGHGIFDLGWRRGPLSVQLLTDTLDVRLRPEARWGRAGLGVRVATFAAGMWLTPWQAGAPDPDRAQQGSYVGVDGLVQRDLGGGVYLEASGWLQHHRFVPLEGATLTLPPTQWGRLAATAGLWRSDGALQARLSARIDATAPGRIAPGIAARARWSPAWTIAPDLALDLGIAESQDDIVATRLGGFTPYHVSFAGLAWAEVWAEDYAVARIGGAVQRGAVRIGPVVDLGVWTLPSLTTADRVGPRPEVGIGLLANVQSGPWFADLSAGFAPTRDRPEGVWRVPVYLMVGYGQRP